MTTSPQPAAGENERDQSKEESHPIHILHSLLWQLQASKPIMSHSQ